MMVDKLKKMEVTQEMTSDLAVIWNYINRNVKWKPL